MHPALRLRARAGVPQLVPPQADVDLQAFVDAERDDVQQIQRRFRYSPSATPTGPTSWSLEERRAHVVLAESYVIHRDVVHMRKLARMIGLFHIQLLGSGTGTSCAPRRRNVARGVGDWQPSTQSGYSRPTAVASPNRSRSFGA
jgi:hypothetical protein